MKLRRARPDDAACFARIKQALPMPEVAEAASGGFLLGTTEATYRQYIGAGHCLVALDAEDGIAGFGILFPDAVLRASDLWEKRDAARWSVAPESFEHRRLAYFEQLAFLPGHRRAAIGLAYRLAHDAFMQGGAEAILTTTVLEPVTNGAALPFIAAAGGMHAGSIEEEYAGAGRILSDIHLIHRRDFLVRTPGLWLRPLFEAAHLQPL